MGEGIHSIGTTLGWEIHTDGTYTRMGHMDTHAWDIHMDGTYTRMGHTRMRLRTDGTNIQMGLYPDGTTHGWGYTQLGLCTDGTHTDGITNG